MKHLFIINPTAGGIEGRLAEIQRDILSFAETLNDPYEVYITSEPMDASFKVSKEADINHKLYVYACGGDGTLSECANGAAGRTGTAITQYPCGTGNDFIKTFGKENIHLFRNLRALSEGHVRQLDLIECNGRYGINICSVGIDARIGTDVHKYSKIPLLGGATGYIVSTIVNVIKGVNQRLHITADDLNIDKEVALVCACNGRFYGGGFSPVPDALPDDGFLDFLIIDRLSRLKVAQTVGKYAKGRYRELSGLITHVHGKHLEIEGDHDFIVNIDGELLITKKVNFTVVPKGINFLFPSGLKLY